MKILKNPKGLDLKPCLNCVPDEDNFICPCSNHSGEIHREIEQGKVRITQFICESRKMHQGFPDTLETHSKTRRAKQSSKTSLDSAPKTR